MRNKELCAPHSAVSKKDDVNQDLSTDLIPRIRMHCQQTAQALKAGSGRVRKTREYVRWFLPERRTSLVLKQEEDGQEPPFAFPPATEQQIEQTEQQLGFPLPPLLRLLYTQIANGGFGPGFGILGVIGGYPGIDHVPGHLARRYQWEIDFADALRQLSLGGWASLTQAGRHVLWEDGIGSQALWEAGELTDDEEEATPLDESFLEAPWPKRLLPLCEHGCNITTYLFADTEQVVQGMHGPDLVVADSLEQWLERWLAGEELQLM